MNSPTLHAWQESAFNNLRLKELGESCCHQDHTHASRHHIESVSQGPHPCWQGHTNSGAETANWACLPRLDAYARLLVLRTHRLQQWPSRFCCDPFVPFTLSGHFRSELRLLNP
ncbi:hypothetical protein PIB30_016104 [Stylosanthes scabra]|uniref:Uncharacterized protein n=1 Tax=Stylosanthes scabra TaxID=79078 RepID=A0ABU6Q7B2_9FABA|nr:hypothetical protein [Stylosanthes scabra]